MIPSAASHELLYRFTFPYARSNVAPFSCRGLSARLMWTVYLLQTAYRPVYATVTASYIVYSSLHSKRATVLCCAVPRPVVHKLRPLSKLGAGRRQARRDSPPFSALACAFRSAASQQLIRWSEVVEAQGVLFVDHTHSFLQSLYALQKSASERLVTMRHCASTGRALTGSSLCTASCPLRSCSGTGCSARQLPGTGRATRSGVCCAAETDVSIGIWHCDAGFSDGGTLQTWPSSPRSTGLCRPLLRQPSGRPESRDRAVVAFRD